MDRKPSFGEKVKKAVFKSAKKKHKEKNVRENPDYDRLRSNQMSEDRVVAEEECLRQRSRILEQIRELKRIDVGQGRKLHICKKSAKISLSSYFLHDIFLVLSTPFFGATMPYNKYYLQS